MHLLHRLYGVDAPALGLPGEFLAGEATQGELQGEYKGNKERDRRHIIGLLHAGTVNYRFTGILRNKNVKQYSYFLKTDH